MTELLAAIAVFILAHAIPAYRPVREAFVRLVGEVIYVSLYTVVSLIIVVWLGYAYASAPFIEVWPFAMELRWAPHLLMPVSCVLLVAGLFSRNPFSIGAGSKGYDPGRPGIVGVTRHPVIWGFVLWSGSHIIPNGDVASLLLFGLLTGLGLLGPHSLDAKRKARMGETAWKSLSAGTSSIPFVALVRGTAGLRGLALWKVLAGLGLYWLLVHFHEDVIAVSPFPY